MTDAYDTPLGALERKPDGPGRWPPMPNPFHDYDDPSSVRVVDYAPPVEVQKTDEVARLGKPWDREARDDLENALTAARAMRDATEAFVGWIGRYDLRVAADYDHLIEEADALIQRLERMAAQL